jgi:hypothetical protein
MYHIVLHHIKEGWKEAHLKLSHSHSHPFTYLIQFNNVDIFFDITLKKCVTPTFYKNKIFVHIGVHIKMHIKL